MSELKPQIDWLPPGKPDWRGRWMNGYASGLAAVLAFLGHQVDYDQVMGDLGLAFVFQGEENSTNRLDGAVDVGWWPLEPLGIIRLDLLEAAVGRVILDLKLPATEREADPRAAYQRYFELALRSSLERRVPAVVRVGSTEYIVTGCDDDAEYPLIGMCPNEQAGKERIYRIEEPLPPYYALIPGETGRSLDRATVDREALRFAISLHRDQVLGGEYEGKFPLRCAGEYGAVWRTGLKAYAAWIACLEDREHPGMHFWHGNVAQHLRLNRDSAARYLTTMQARFPSAAGQDLAVAIETYRAIAEEVAGWDTSREALSQAEGRRALVARIRQVMGSEQRAVQALERAEGALL